MIELLPPVKWIHVAAVMASGTLFALRGLLVLANRPGLAMAASVRYLSYAIDTVLLVAGVAMVVALPWAVFANGWLGAKLVLLVAYIVLGSFALRRGRTPRIRLACYFAALGTFACIYTIARAHHPAGLLWPLLAS